MSGEQSDAATPQLSINGEPVREMKAGGAVFYGDLDSHHVVLNSSGELLYCEGTLNGNTELKPRKIGDGEYELVATDGSAIPTITVEVSADE